MTKAALGAASIAAVLVLAGCASPPNNDRAELRDAGDGFPALAGNWYDGGKTVTIDGKEYTLESLGQQGREQLQNLRVTDQELQRLQDQLAITQTARNTYARILAEVTQSVTPVK
nr:DUF6447 family protein [Halomonas sp. IOP_6]